MFADVAGVFESFTYGCPPVQDNFRPMLFYTFGHLVHNFTGVFVIGVLVREYYGTAVLVSNFSHERTFPSVSTPPCVSQDTDSTMPRVGFFESRVEFFK